MDRAAREAGFSWDEHKVDQETFVAQGRTLAMELAQIAQAYGMRLKVCAQKQFLVAGLIEEARCIDAERLERIGQRVIPDKRKQVGSRKECACFASKDIGEYDTCPHGCVYCYAVQHRNLALSRYKKHDPQGEFLFPPAGYTPEDTKPEIGTQKWRPLPLFSS